MHLLRTNRWITPLACCLALTLALTACAGSATATPTPSNRTLVVQAVTGTVEVTTAKGKTTPAQVGDTLQVGELGAHL